ncbi:MAG: hypothetical protein Q4D06_05640 [Coriobacteriia bacterium]|nr:hypothetical protein [Coriobacteriia bacterium]
MSVLDQLIEQARQEERRRAESVPALRGAVAAEFAVTTAAEQNREELLELIKPLQELLPSALDYQDWASAHDGLCAGPRKGMPPASWPGLKKRRHLVNPTSVLLTMGYRSEQATGDYFPEISEEEYNRRLQTTDSLSEYWGKTGMITSHDLARAVVFQTVLEDEELRELVFARAQERIGELVESGQWLGAWRS